MKQYINKSAVMAEIEKRIKKYASIGVGDSRELDALYGAKCKALMEILSFLDTIETKEVDLEQEIKDILNQYYYFPEEAIDIPTIIRITAHHFFEIGLKTQKGE